ncbi:Dystonin, partial [Pseudolycoriella hygida]
IYDGKCLHYVDWLVETRPSFSPPRRDMRLPDADPGATEVFTQRLDDLNRKFEKLLESLSQRLKTAVEVGGVDGLRYAESRNEPLRTYRVEFNLGGPHGDAPIEDRYTSTYSTTNISTSKLNTSKTIVHDTTDYSSNYESTSRSNKNQEPSPTSGDSVHFSEIRSHKRIIQSHESVGTDNKILDTTGIIDPKTGRNLTVGEAIQMRILDVRTGEILITERGKRISIEEAVRQKLIDPSLASSLLQPGAALDQQGHPISLLQVIQKEISEAENGYDSTAKRIKVTTYNSEEGPSISIADAISKGIVDSKTGLYRTKAGTFISITEAYNRGYLSRKQQVTLRPNILCLSDAIAHGLVDTSGWVVDRNTGETFRLDKAIDNGLIDANTREIVDAKNDVKVTLQQALNSGILNAKTGRYVQDVSKEKLTFIEAKNRQLICKPFTLKDACDLNSLDKNGLLQSPTRRQKLSIIEAMNVGVLDSDNYESVTVNKGELVTLSEALARGVVLPESKYVDNSTKEVMSIPDAVGRGLISSVSVKSIFHIEGFRDPYSGDNVSLEQALAKNILRRQSDCFKLDSGKGNLVSLSTSVEDGHIRPEIYEMFNRKIGVAHPVDGSELSVLDIVFHDFIDPKTGFLKDPVTKAILPLNNALENEFITPEGALLLNSLLNIKLTTETVIKSVNRYVTITDTEQPENANVILTFTEAVRKGLVDEARQMFKDPNTGNVYSVQQALNYGLLTPDPDSSPLSPTTTIKIVHKTILPKESVEAVPSSSPKPVEYTTIRSKTTYETPQLESVKSTTTSSTLTTTTKSNVSKSVTDFINIERESAIKERQVLELPPEGWFLSEAIEQKLFDPKTGLFLIPGTDRLVSFEECIKLQIINPNSVSVVDPSNDRKITVLRSFDKRILDATGNYRSKSKLIDMTDAIKTGRIILEVPRDIDVSNQRLIQIIKETGKPTVVEVSNKLDSNPPTFTSVKVASIDLPSPEPVQLSPGIIYDPSTALVIFTDTGKSESIITAVKEGKIDENLVKINDPATGKSITIGEAIRSSIVDPNTGELSDGTGSKISLIEAVKYGLLAVVGTPLVAAAGAINSLKLVVDPKTGEEIPIELAYERGIVPRDEPLGKQASTTRNIIFRSPETGKDITLEEAIETGLVDPADVDKLLNSNSSSIITSSMQSFSTRTRSTSVVVKDPKTGEKVSLEEAVARGLITAEEADKLDKSTTPVQTTIVINDPKTGKSLSLEEAVAEGLLSPDDALSLQQSDTPVTSTIVIQDPKTGNTISLKEAMDKGLIDQSDVDRILKSNELPTQMEVDSDTLHATVPELCKNDSSKSSKVLTLESISLDDGTLPAPGELTRARVTTEPKFQVSIGRARSLSQSPDKDGRPVVLQKMRKRIVKPVDALENGIIDKQTALVLDRRETFTDPNGESLSLAEAIALKQIDGESGKIVDPQRGDILNINEAIDRGILDPEGTNHILVPLNKSLSVPQLQTQGLIDPNSRMIIHPETGNALSLKEAIVCEIVDQFSKLKEPTGAVVTLQKAIEKGCVDDENSTVITREGTVDLLNAVRQNVFVTQEAAPSTSDIPIIGMTLPVAVKRGLVDEHNYNISHPITHQTQSIPDAINSHFIMPVPYAPNADGIPIEEALTRHLIDTKTSTFKNPNSGEILPLSEAIETGLLIIKPLPELMALYSSGPVTSVTETKTSVHTITTKTVELLSGFQLVSANEVRNLQTGESYTLEDAKGFGIIKDESHTREQFATREIKVNFSDAIRRGLVNIRAGTFTDPQSGAIMPIQQAVDDGFLEAGNEGIGDDVEDVDDNVQKVTHSEKQAFESVNNVQQKDTLTSSIKISETTLVDPYKREVPQQEFVDSKGKEGSKKDLEPKAKGEDSKFNVKDAAKMGLMAVVGAPILAGMAITDAVKKVARKIESESVTTEVDEPTKIVDRQIPTTKSEIVVTDVLKKVTPDVPDTFVEFTSESSTQLPLKDAISLSKIDPESCEIIVNGKTLKPTVREALVADQINLTDIVEVLSRKQIVLIETIQPEISLTEFLTMEQVAEIGAYDIDADCFVDPQTGDRISFVSFIYDLGIFDPDRIFVKDQRLDKFEPLATALEKPLIDRHTGHMVDSKTGKRVPFFECIEKGWIIQKSPKDLEATDLSNAAIDPITGDVSLNDGERVPIEEAIDSGLVNIDTVSIRDPVTSEIIPMAVAIQKGIVDLKRGIIINTVTHEEIPMATAYSQKLLISGSRQPVSLEAVVNQGLYDSKTGKILDTVDNGVVNIEDSIHKGIVDPTISLIKNTKSTKLATLTEALEENLVDSDSGTIKDVKKAKFVTLDEAVKQNLISTKEVTWDFLEVLQKGYYSPQTGKILNPMTGEQDTLQKSIDVGFVDISGTLVKDDQNDSVVNCADAIEDGLIDVSRGVLTQPEMKLDSALEKGYLLSSKKPLSLIDILVRNMYDPLTGLITIDGVQMTLKDAIDKGLIKTNEVIVRDPKTGNIYPLIEAIQLGIVEPSSGLYVDLHSGLQLNLVDSLERGLLIQPKRKCSLPDAVFKGLYDPKSGTFSSTLTSEKLSTDRAIKRGIIDPQSTIVNVNGKVLPFELAVESGLVNARRGTVVDDQGNKIDYREAFDRGILIEVKNPISLSEALLKGLYDETTGLIMDPQTGKQLTLSQSLVKKLIDPNSVQMKDQSTGLYKPISLFEATESGIINGQNSQVLFNDGRISLKEAFATGLLCDTKAPISVQRAIHQGLYDEKTGKIHDPHSGRKITLFEATRKFVINPQLPCYFNEKEERLLSLSDTCRAQLIDRREGVFKEPGSDVFIPLNQALALGLIVDIESGGFGLYETLAMGLYENESKLIIHPVNNGRFTLKQACDMDVVNALSSLVKAPDGRYVRLDKAVELGCINDEEGVYLLPKYSIDLQEARHRGLIVTNQKLLSVEKAIKNQLYRSDNGKFVDPSVNQFYDIQGGIDCGLIDGDTTVFKNLLTGQQKPIDQAIKEGDIDVARGRVLDPKTKRSYNFDVALSNGLLVTVEKPITGRNLIRKDSIDVFSPTAANKQPREMSLDEAIRYEIINPETAVVKDPTISKFKTLGDLMSEKTVDLEQRAVIDPSSLFFTFDPTFVVYVHKPLSFDEAVESQALDLSTAKFTDPLDNTIHSLKDAINIGRMDPESALIKDGAKKKLVRLPEGYRKGLIDADKSNVLDSTTSKLVTLDTAVETGLIITPKRAFSLLEALNYSLYNPTTGGFSDPFSTTSVIERRRLTLNDSIASGLIDPTSTVVRDSANGSIVPLVTALGTGLVDPIAGRLNESSDKSIDLIKAMDSGLLLAAEQRQAVIEKFNLCEDNLSGLLKWIAQVEQKIASVGGPKERIDELRNQINVLKQIKDDIDSQSRPVSSCLEQVRQLVLTGGDVLSAPEVSALESSGRELRSRVDHAQERTSKLLRRLESARDELGKLRSELEIFATWLQSARRTLEDKERALSDLNRLTSQAESTREFVSDVIAHQADLRFISMSAQKFVDESKDYLNILNDFRTSLPERLHHIEPLASSESPIRKEVQLVSAQYKDLLNRANALSDRLSGLGGRQRDYQDALDKAQKWLNEVQPRVSKTLSDPIAADPLAVQEQMAEAKSLHNEFLSQGRLIENAQQSLATLLKSLAGQLSPSEVSALEIPVEQVRDRYSQMLEALGDRCKLLDTALVQSQGVQDALDGLVNWVNQAEDKFKLNFRPASLIKERLQDQVREHRTLMADLESHHASMASVTKSAEDLIATASNARMAKKIEGKLQDVVGRYEKLFEKASKRGEFLDETLAQLNTFNDDSSSVEVELSNLYETLDSRELTSLPAEDLAKRMYEMARIKDNLRPAYENCVRLGKDLVGKRDVTDTGPVRDRVKALETQWKNLDTSLDEKAKLSKQKAEHLSSYEKLKDQVLGWLSRIETKTNSLSPAAVDLDVIARQIEELKPIIKEHRDYGPTIDKVNDLGSQYEALIRPDSPGRKRSTYSPTKRPTVSPLRRMSGDDRASSPGKTSILSPAVSPLSPGGSSGFGSRRSSQDGFQLSDLSPIQQQLTEINNRYSLVGVRLNDRSNELDSLKEEVRKHHESLKTLSAFLDKIQRQVPKEAIGTKEEAERCTKQARKVLEEMYERQSLLDSTKAQIKDLLKRKPDVAGADRLRIELEEVADRWKGLNDLCKDRINFSEQLRDFLDTHDNLSTWLSAKERMLTVLGPISSDPRMVQSQVQQVQVLREEFRGQQPQLNHLQDVGHVVIDYLNASSPEGKAVSAKLNNVQTKWDDLVARLEERAQSLGAAADSSKEFDAGLNRLREALQTISDNLDALPHDRDHQETLRKIENLDRQLEGQRPLLADAEAAADALCKVLGDPASRADVNARVGALGKQYQALQKKLDNRKAEMEAALRDGRQFGESCARTLGWLASELGELSERLLISAHKPVLQHQIDTHEPIYREVMAREHEIIMLLNKGKELQGKPTSTDRTLQRDLDKISQQWDKLRREAVDRHSRLQTCMEQCKKYGSASEAFVSWLRTAEDKLASLRPGILKKSQLDQQLKELQAFRSEVWKRSGEYDSTKSLGDTFLSSCDIDKDPVKAELQDIKERWEKLNNDLLSRAQTLETCARRLGDFNEELRDLDNAVARCEDRLGAHDALGGAAKDPKLLDRVKQIREDAAALKKPLQSLRKLATDISLETRNAGGDAEHLKGEVEAVGDRIDDLHNRLDDRCGELQSAATAVTQFNEQVKNLTLDLSELEHIVDSLSPPGREVRVVLGQLDEVAAILDKIDRKADNVAEVERAGQTLVDSGFSPDTIQTREQIAALRKTLGRLDNRAKDHDEALQKTLKALQKFYDGHTSVMDDLQDVRDQLRKMKPVSSELEQIRLQQDDLRKFRDRTVEPLSKQIVEVNRSGQELVRSAQGGVSTAALEKDLEKLNEQWNDLKDKLNERERRLDVALLQSGKFQEALDGLSKWLSDTEEMVANQKPPSADYKVVKAQLQEQKFLKKLLLDRQNSMSSLFALGQEVAGNCEPAEKAAIERQLKELMGRFDALTDTAQKRTLDLEQAMQVAKKFQDKLVPLSNWLDGAERSVKNMELVPTDEEKIQQRIREHDALHNEILDKKPDFSELTDIAGQLMELVGEDEAVGLSEKVRGITDRYTNLVDASDNVGQLLAESRQGLRHLVLTYQELVAWMESMEQRLARYRVVPVHTDKLLEQMDILVDLNEDIASRAPNVDSTVETGSELMKHITADEAIQLKDKLDSIQRRYGELATKGGDLLKNTQDALPIVQKFHNAHNRLVEWMQAAEGALASGEPRESDILRLEGELSEMRPVLECVNQVGPQICQVSPGEGASTIESLVSRDNRRFDAIVEQIQRKAERLHLSKQRSKEVTGDLDELLEWFRDMDASLRDADPPAIEPKLVRAQLQEHRSINDDISSQKGRVRDVTAAAKKVLRESQPNDNTAALREKLEDLKEVVDTVAQLCSDRLSVLEQALPLSEHFADSHSAIASWLDDMEHQISILSMPALRPDQIAIQQDKNERLVQSISEHKPLLDKLNKTGEALANLVADEDAAKINDILDSDNARYAALRTELRERQQALDQALQESSQFSDKLEGMLRALANTAEQVNQADPISVHPPKIRDQIEDNNALIDDLDKRSEAFAAVKRAASDVIAKAGNTSDPAVKDIKKKLEKLNNLWNDLQKATSKRGGSLEDALAAAEKFWKQLKAVMETLNDLEESLTSQEPPAAQPQEIKKQQVALQEIRHEIDQTKPEVEEVRRTGTNLMSLCGEPDKPEVKKHIEDLDHAWDNITALYAKREENLIDAMEKAMEFHETLQNLLAFLAKAEDRFVHLGPIGSDIEAVKKQIEQLKRFKDDVDPHMVEVEALNRQAVDLTERTSPEQAAAIREPLHSVNRRWENLLKGMVERQKQLEHALLHLGQFQHALNELLVWINKTDNTLDQLKPIPGDPQLNEIELAKLKVLANDIQAHQSSVDTLNDAGRQLIESDRGSLEASTTQEKLKKLNVQWKDLLQKAADRQHELEEALRDAQAFIAEVQDILGWLGDVDGVIGAGKPVGGLPETASEQLERFMEIFNELEDNRPKVETLQAQGQEYIKKQTQMKASSSNLQHILRTLKQRWDAVLSRASDKKIKLEIALKEANEFHDALQAFVEWLTNAEKQLASASSVSRVLEIIQTQIEEHKILQKDVSIHREAMLLLDKKGTHLKYFSQKQDVILIKNLLVSVQHRWERIVAKAAERTRALDHGYKEAREFHESWHGLLTWLQETETNLDHLAEEAASSNDAVKIKKHLDRLKETQRSLSSKQGQFDTTMRSGKSLIDRAPKSDEPILSKMLNELKETWTRVCTKSVDRQRKLEEALLLSGQFSDALQALLEWLRKTKNRLSEEGPVHGDLETVTQLMDQHKNLESDLQKRANQMESVLKTGKELERSGDAKDLSKSLTEVQRLWSDVTDLSERRGRRLLDALREAERLHKQVHMLLEWLSEAEQQLRFAASMPDDESHARELLEMHSKFLKELREKERDKDDTLRLANNILGKAYPDAIPIIKNWITIIQSRWDEVSQWALSRETKLRSHMQSLKDLDDSIEELLAWLSGLEATLLSLESEPLPEEIPVVEQLIVDHKEFMENTARRQPEIDRACKPKQPPAGSKEARKQSQSRSGKTPVFKGSRDQGLNSRRTSNSGDVEFRSSRARTLWDKWRYVWMLAWERQRRLHEHLLYLKDVERVRQFSWDDWRKRFLKFMNHKKSRLTDLFRKMDKDNNGLIPRDVFIDGIINTKFDTSRMEMGAVADLFDRNGEGLIDWQEFIAALRPDWQDRKPATDADKIHDEVKRLVMLCTCRQKFRVFQVGEGKYRFGDSQKLRLVRILRSTVMVRVGGGWVALDEFLVKNDPCRADEHLAELMPIFERLRAQEQIPCAYPLHMGAGGTAFIRGGSRSMPLSPHAPHCHPATHWVRERSVRSVAMSRPSRSSLSASTPDSLSDNESSLGAGGRYTPRKPSYTPNRTGFTPGGSRNGSKPNSRPASRTGSKPPSHHGSNMSLDSTDETTPSRIPQRRLGSTSSTTTTPRPSRLSVGSTITRVNGNTGISAFGSTISRPRTPSGSASPAPTRSNGGMSRSSSIPTLVPGTPNRRNLSGQSTPSGMQTPRKTSMEPPPVPPGRKSRGSTPNNQREPFRL